MHTWGYWRIPTFWLKAVNIGKRPITIAKVGIRIPNGKEFWMPDVQMRLPTTLSDGGSSELIINIHDLCKSLESEGYNGPVKIKGSITDESGNRYLSKKLLVKPMDYT